MEGQVVTNHVLIFQETKSIFIVILSNYRGVHILNLSNFATWWASLNYITFNNSTCNENFNALFPIEIHFPTSNCCANRTFSSSYNVHVSRVTSALIFKNILDFPIFLHIFETWTALYFIDRKWLGKESLKLYFSRSHYNEVEQKIVWVYCYSSSPTHEKFEKYLS